MTDDYIYLVPFTRIAYVWCTLLGESIKYSIVKFRLYLFIGLVRVYFSPCGDKCTNKP